MAKNNTVIEDALFQIKNLEESLNKNAQGILSSTMKNEIKSLVKESLKEQDEIEDEEVDVEETDTDNEESMVADVEQGVEDVDDEMTPTAPMSSDDDETIDMTKASDSEVLRVFKAMKDEDGIIIKKDDDMLHLSDPSKDVEYLIQLGESEEEFGYMPDEDELMEMMGLEDEDDDFEIMEFMGDSDEDEDSDFDLYFDELEEDYDEDEDDYMPIEEIEMEPGLVANPSAARTQGQTPTQDKPMQETIYELELGDEDEEKEFDFDMEMFEDASENVRFISPDDELDDESEEEVDEMIYEAAKKVKMKAKGMGMGSASKFKYAKKPNQDYKPKKMKQGTRGVGMGKAKFEYKEEVNGDGFSMKPKPRKEFKEAARTYGNGSKSGRGLRKGITPNRNLTYENVTELKTLREKNTEYRKALDLFRTKLNEVAVFNSNLAYATRLFTEHSTTKQEKINILRRFDNVETLKESKNLYKNIKNELSTSKVGGENTINESVQRTVSKAPTTGSAVSLIESKTYENPQFLRMKDLMGKIK